MDMPNLNENATEAEPMMCIAYVEPVLVVSVLCTVKLSGAAEAENGALGCKLLFKLCCLHKAEVLSE